MPKSPHSPLIVAHAAPRRKPHISVERKFYRIVTIDASLSERSSHRLSRGESSAAKRLSTVISFRIRKKTSDQRTASAAIRAPKDSQICRFNVSLEFEGIEHREPAHHRGRSADCSRIDAPRAAPGSAGVQFTPAGLADGELFGLNKRGNLSLNLRGVGDGTGVGVGLGDA